MPSLLALITFGRAWWRPLVAALALLAILAAAWRVYEAGRSSERAKQEQASTAILRERARIDERLSNESDLALCRRLNGGAGCGVLQDGAAGGLRRLPDRVP